jgi:hypothetical protein
MTAFLESGRYLEILTQTHMQLLSVDKYEGKLMCAAVLYKGKISDYEINQDIKFIEHQPKVIFFCTLMTTFV